MDRLTGSPLVFLLRDVVFSCVFAPAARGSGQRMESDRLFFNLDSLCSVGGDSAAPDRFPVQTELITFLSCGVIHQQDQKISVFIREHFIFITAPSGKADMSFDHPMFMKKGSCSARILLTAAMAENVRASSDG